MTDTDTRTGGNSKSAAEKEQNDVDAVVDYLEGEDLFSVMPGRSHTGFKNYALCTGVKDHDKFRTRFMKHRENLARRKELRVN